MGSNRVYWSPVPVKLGYPLSIEWDKGLDSTVQTINGGLFPPGAAPGGENTPILQVLTMFKASILMWLFAESFGRLWRGSILWDFWVSSGLRHM